MKIAVACMGESVADHFGHCEGFYIFQAEDGAITAQSQIKNPGHKPGLLPNLLADMGVNTIIAGGIGGGAVHIFNQRDIEVIAGAEGPARAAVERYLKGELESTGAVCHEHAHAGECSDHGAI